MPPEGPGSLPEVREGLRGPSKCLGGFGRPYRRSGRSREALSEVRDSLPEVREGLRGLSEHLGEDKRPS